MFIKRCFVCGAREDGNNHCTNPDCPRYVAADTATATKTETNTGAAAK